MEGADYTHRMADTTQQPPERRRGPEPPDLAEKGGIRNGVQQRSNDRLFVQLLVFGDCHDAAPLAAALEASGVTGVLYEDVNDPHGVAIATLTQDPNDFIDRVRRMLALEPFASLTQKPEYTMLGRTYSLGYEPDLTDVLLHRPRRTVLNPEWRWTVWYPLRRSGRFSALPVEEQRVILAEHGAIGMSFGAADLAHDIRLACHGLDKNDNDFIVGLFGKDLFPLSAIVQTMRKTQQTSLYLERLGPFFIGRVAWQSPV